MATTTTRANTLALELDGQAAGSLRSVQPASLRVEAAGGSGAEPQMVLRAGVRVVLGEMAAEVDLVEPGPLLAWLQDTLAGKFATHAGAVVVADFNREQRRRISFNGAWLTAVAWPVLDAAQPRGTFTLGLRWLAEQVDDAPASGKLKTLAPGRRKAMMTGNFRVLGLPFGGAAVVRVALPAVSLPWTADTIGVVREPQLHVGQRRLGDLVLNIGARDADAARKWARQLVADGRVDANEGLALQVEMLDATLKNVLATIRLDTCMLRGLDEDPLGSAAERAPGLALRFAVDGLALKVV